MKILILDRSAIQSPHDIAERKPFGTTDYIMLRHNLYPWVSDGWKVAIATNEPQIAWRVGEAKDLNPGMYIRVKLDGVVADHAEMRIESIQPFMPNSLRMELFSSGTGFEGKPVHRLHHKATGEKVTWRWSGVDAVMPDYYRLLKEVPDISAAFFCSDPGDEAPEVNFCMKLWLEDFGDRDPYEKSELLGDRPRVGEIWEGFRPKDCRKPAAGMIWYALKHWAIALPWFVPSHFENRAACRLCIVSALESDRQLAENLGCEFVAVEGRQWLKN